MDMKQFSTQHRVRIRRDGCGEEIILGRQFCADMPKRTEYRAHVYEYGDSRLGVMLLFTSARKWESAKRKLTAAGFTLRQDGHTEGTLLFDPANEAQARLALAVIRAKRIRELSPAHRATATAVLAASRTLTKAA